MAGSATFSAQPDAAALLARWYFARRAHLLFYGCTPVEPHIMLSRVWNALAEKATRM